MLKKTEIDYPVFLLTVLLTVIGIILIYSANYTNDSEWMQTLYQKQILRAVAGFLLIYFIQLIPHRVLFSLAYPAYFFSLFILIIVLFFGDSAGGAARWISIAGIKIQPAEFTKFAVLIALARYLSGHEMSFTHTRTLVVPFIIFMVPLFLVLKQPDLGTSLVFGAIAFAMFYWGGLSLLELFFITSGILSLVLSFNTLYWGIFFVILIILLFKFSRNFALTVGIILFNFLIGAIIPRLWDSLHDYQKDRIIAFIDPSHDPFGAGYQVIQSQVAIGSGGLTGKGFLQGTQTTLSFLPEQHTDFILSVLGEQFGFLGIFTLLLLFGLLIGRIFYLLSLHNNRFINLIFVGIGAQLSFHIIVNIAMTVGMMPVTGLPLPFISYGGSFLITCLALIGLSLNVNKNRGDI